MLEVSVIIPHREAGDALLRQSLLVSQVLARLQRSHEVLCVGHGSHAGQMAFPHFPTEGNLRVIKLSGGRDLSSALSAGVAAARGEVIVAMEAGEQFDAEQIGWLIERLARADMVFGRRRFGRGQKCWTWFTQLPRRMLLGLEARDPDCLFWAAQREAVLGLEMGRGMHRFLASLVSMRGYRVTEIHVDHQARQPVWRSLRLATGNLLAVWWLKRGREDYCAHEGVKTKSARSPMRHGADAGPTASIQRGSETRPVS